MKLAWTSWTDDMVSVLRTKNLSVGDVFTLQSAYTLEEILKKIRPQNNNIRAKIRQQMQVLKHHGFVDFVDGNGVYRLIKSL
mgnify:FL=1|jgi:type II restriction enzyme